MPALIIADDHPLFRTALEQLFSMQYPDMDILTAPDVAGLQTAVEKHRDIAAVLLDLHMPGAHGFSALSWLTGQRRLHVVELRCVVGDELIVEPVILDEVFQHTVEEDLVSVSDAEKPASVRHAGV